MPLPIYLQQKSKGIRKLFLDNLGLKVLAVLLSIALWVFATSHGLSEVSLDVPLELKNIPSGLELVSHSAKVVSLSIRGQERLIRNIRPSDIRVSVDMSKAKKGESTYPINKKTIRLPYAVTVTNITPSSVKVQLEETATKTVKVRPVVVGTPEEGFYIKSIGVVPQTVVIEGRRAEVKKVDTIKTEPIDITDYKETVSMDSKLNFSGINIRTKTDEVTVKVVIAGRKK